ncbi:hypothetical protein D3C76_1652200 [compost metagenome]
MPDGGRIDTDVFHAVFVGEVFDLLCLVGKVHALPLVALQYAKLAPGYHRRGDNGAPGTVAAIGF